MDNLNITFSERWYLIICCSHLILNLQCNPCCWILTCSSEPDPSFKITKGKKCCPSYWPYQNMEYIYISKKKKKKKKWLGKHSIFIRLDVIWGKSENCNLNLAPFGQNARHCKLLIFFWRIDPTYLEMSCECSTTVFFYWPWKQLLITAKL